MKRGQLTVVLNREAGTLVRLGPEQVEAHLRDIFTAEGCGVDILNVTGAKVEDTLRQALGGNADAVIVCGNWFVKTIRTAMDAIRSASTFPPLDLRLNKNGATASHRTRMAMIANNDYDDMFGIIPARSSLDAGYFTVYISKHRTRLGMARSVLAWLLGRWKLDREIISLRATELEIDVTRKRRLAVMMDGEVDKVALPFKVILRPKILRVISPRIEEEPRSTP